MSRGPRNVIRPGDGDGRHGTENGYYNLRCRCDACRAANVQAVARRRIQRFAALADDDPRHGRLTTYTNYGCRCPECRAANASYQRERRAKRWTS